MSCLWVKVAALTNAKTDSKFEFSQFQLPIYYERDSLPT